MVQETGPIRSSAGLRVRRFRTKVTSSDTVGTEADPTLFRIIPHKLGSAAKAEQSQIVAVNRDCSAMRLLQPALLLSKFCSILLSYQCNRCIGMSGKLRFVAFQILYSDIRTDFAHFF